MTLSQIRFGILKGKCKLCIFFIFLNIFVLSYTFLQPIISKNYQAMPHAVGYHVLSMSIAISELIYGTNSYTGYRIVYDTLFKNGMDFEKSAQIESNKSETEILTDPVGLNNAIKSAININILDKNNKLFLEREDLGLITFYKLAFILFGFNIQSLYFLYFLLFAISVLIYLYTFSDKIYLLFYLY